MLREERFVQVITDRDNYFCGDTVYITIRVLGERQLAEISCHINTPDGKKVKLEMSSVSDGYSATFIPRKRGIYKVEVSASHKGGKTSGDSISFIAGEPSMEFVNTELNDELLKRLSEKSGGRYYTSETIWKLPDDIVIREKSVSRVCERKLWNNPWLFIGFLTLLTVEWVVRKNKQLM